MFKFGSLTAAVSVVPLTAYLYYQDSNKGSSLTEKNKT